MQDLSHLAVDSMWPTAQEGGNMTSSRPAAMSAPGSEPVTPQPPASEQTRPAMTLPPQTDPGDDGKPRARSGPLSQGPPAWTKTTTPDVVRES